MIKNLKSDYSEKTNLILKKQWKFAGLEKLHALKLKQSKVTSYRALTRKKNNSAFCMNWKIKHCWGSGPTVNPSVGSIYIHFAQVRRD